MREVLAARRASLDEEPLAGLRGRFHSHLTVRGDATEQLARAARDVQAKVTVIDLAGDRRAERDVMLTRYHLDDAPGALGRVADALQSMCDTLEAEGIEVARVKVEHESEPSLPRFDAERYHEVHIKLAIEPARFDEVYTWLTRGDHGWVASRNPRERRPDRVLQFVTLRCYDGDRADADARVARASATLRDAGLEIVEIKRETAVLDTDLARDAWWAS
jgi:hypothetical protein